VSVKKLALVGLPMLLLALAIFTTLLARHWPFSKARVTQSLQSTFPATVTFTKFRATYLPHPGCVAEGLVFTRLGSTSGTPPVVTVQQLTIQAHYLDLLLRPGYLSQIVLKDLLVHIPPIGTPVEESNWQETPSTTRVGEIVADGSTIQVDRASGPPLLFAIPTMHLESVADNQPLGFTVALHIPLPPGDVRATGKFGPWNYNEPGKTPVAGEYTFQNADLSVFYGIAGVLSAHDKFQGILRQIDSNGTIDVPNFMVTRSDHAVHLKSSFHAIVNGTNGDIQIDRVTANFLNTSVLAKGQIAHHAGQDGKLTTVDLSVQNGCIQDILRMFVHGHHPPLQGTTNFRAHVIIPPSDAPFLHKLCLVGDFGIGDGQFAKPATQISVDTLSQRALGEKVSPAVTPAISNPDASDPGGVISELAGHVELRNGTATLNDLRFAVPGASAHMHGTYNLETLAIDLHGTLKTEEEFSGLASAFKSVMLKPFNVFFRKKHAGAVLPVHLTGTYKKPEAGLDLPVK
jgi:AsmA-like C-terminal region